MLFNNDIILIDEDLKFSLASSVNSLVLFHWPTRPRPRKRILTKEKSISGRWPCRPVKPPSLFSSKGSLSLVKSHPDDIGGVGYCA